MGLRAEPSGFLRAALPVAGVGLSWSALSIWLALNGHEPSGPVFVAPRAMYYAAQAVFAPPVLLLQFWVLCGVCGLIAGAKRGDLPLQALSTAFAAPLFFLWLLPDAVAYGVWGFGALTQVVRIAAPATAVVTVLLVARHLKQRLALSLGRAVLAAVGGCVAQAVLGGAVLR
ncbi:MAG TPA: hypothetical protein PKD61_14715 [Polyangiaceae bacterium]|nr:hypothetical protein [Polyangiaceae bacterium]